ncbi:hypothetical protein [Alkalicoccus daliensis]|nr:hypothetical protein [Alkalicoccus daliensis]
MSERLLEAAFSRQESATCPYCGGVLQHRYVEYYCTYCSMQLQTFDTHRNGERIPPPKVRTVLGVHLNKSTPELMKFSTFELLQLLKLAREEQEETHHLLHTITKLQKATGEEILRREEQISNNVYEKITRKVYAIETLLQQRLDFIPRKITEDALFRYEEKLSDTKKRYI